MNKEPIHVIGAEPAGLVAAINLAKNGYPVTVYVMNKDAGRRFNGDYQGIKNWPTEENARQFLQDVGIETNFRLYVMGIRMKEFGYRVTEIIDKKQGIIWQKFNSNADDNYFIIRLL